MARTTSTLVAGIIEIDAGIVIDPFILAAGVLVDRIDTADMDNEVADSTLQVIETWLAAHFYAMRDPRRTQEHAGPVGESFQSKVDLFLSTSHYGQMAMLLDPTGTLAAINAEAAAGGVRQTVGVHWLGTEDE